MEILSASTRIQLNLQSITKTNEPEKQLPLNVFLFTQGTFEEFKTW